MYKKLNIKNLIPGDIILVGYNDEDSREIQKRTNSRFSHSMLYWYGSIIHASDIVITENPSRMLFEEDEDVCILRLKDNYWNPKRISSIIDYARTLVGTFYDRKALIAMRDGKKVTPKENRQMCARFVAECYDYVCLDLVKNHETCTPEDIFKSTILNQIPNPLLEATQEDIDMAASFDVTKVQFKAIKEFLISLKKQFPREDIVSLNQVEQFIEKKPSNGDCVLNLLKETEYFNLWKIEKEHNPYLYDAEAFKNKWNDCAKNQALSIVRDSNRIIKEKKHDINIYKLKLFEIGNLAYYHEMITLRENIIKTANERIDVAEQVLMGLGIVKIQIPWCL